MIRGSFAEDLPWPVPMVRAMVFLPEPGALLGSVEFVLDTGSDSTTLHPSDAVKNLGLTLAQLRELYRWGQPRTSRGIGGTAPYFGLRASYFFLHEEVRLQTIEGLILVSPPHPDNERLPSLLGWDVLRHFRLALDWDTRLITLRERSE